MTALFSTAFGMGPGGQIGAGFAQAGADNYNAAVALQNKTAITQQSEAAAEVQRQSALRAIGATRAGYGGAGVTASGTPLDVLSASASNAELDRQNILYKGKLQAAGYQDEATLDKYSASGAIMGGFMNAVASAGQDAGKAISMGAG